MDLKEIIRVKQASIKRPPLNNILEMAKLQNYKNLTGDRLVNARPWDGREEKRAECGYIKNDIQWIPIVM